MSMQDYREGVCIWLYHCGNIVVVQPPLWRGRGWRFPSEGKERNETNLEETVHRGLQEELGVVGAEILDRSRHVRTFTWPQEVRLKNMMMYGREYLGQRHTSFLVAYRGAREELSPAREEIGQLNWVRAEEFSRYFFFRGQYEHARKVAQEFGLLV